MLGAISNPAIAAKLVPMIHATARIRLGFAPLSDSRVEPSTTARMLSPIRVLRSRNVSAAVSSVATTKMISWFLPMWVPRKATLFVDRKDGKFSVTVP